MGEAMVDLVFSGDDIVRRMAEPSRSGDDIARRRADLSMSGNSIVRRINLREW